MGSVVLDVGVLNIWHWIVVYEQFARLVINFFDNEKQRVKFPVGLGTNVQSYSCFQLHIRVKRQRDSVRQSLSLSRMCLAFVTRENLHVSYCALCLRGLCDSCLGHLVILPSQSGAFHYFLPKVMLGLTFGHFIIKFTVNYILEDRHTFG